MEIKKEELDELLKKARSETKQKMTGKRKVIYCSIAGILVFGMTFGIVLIYGVKAGDIFNWPYVAICAILIGLYPVLNTISKFALKIPSNKIAKIIEAIAKLSSDGSSYR